MDESLKQDVKQIHYANLWKIVNYCENTNDCRRVLQLQYMGKVFDSRHCNDSGKEVHGRVLSRFFDPFGHETTYAPRVALLLEKSKPRNWSQEVLGIGNI